MFQNRKNRIQLLRTYLDRIRSMTFFKIRSGSMFFTRSDPDPEPHLSYLLSCKIRNHCGPCHLWPDTVDEGCKRPLWETTRKNSRSKCPWRLGRGYGTIKKLTKTENPRALLLNEVTHGHTLLVGNHPLGTEDWVHLFHSVSGQLWYYKNRKKVPVLST